jgi:hypothetical protein
MLWVVSRGLPEHPQAPALALGANEHCARAAHVTTAAPPDGRLPWEEAHTAKARNPRNSY